MHDSEPPRLRGADEPAGHPERRAARRHAPYHAPVFLSDITEEPEQLSEGWVLDSSMLGLAVSSSRPYEPGAVLIISRPDAPADTAMMKVKYCERDLAHWRVGCEFLSLVSRGFLQFLGLGAPVVRR